MSAEASHRIDVQALAALKKLKKTPELNFISMALHGKKQGFEKVIKLIDNLVATLGKEQVDDDKHKDWCAAESAEGHERRYTGTVFTIFRVLSVHRDIFHNI